MPFRSFDELEQFKLIVKEADALGVLGVEKAFAHLTLEPVCAMGHAAAYKGITPLSHESPLKNLERCGRVWGLKLVETQQITGSNDDLDSLIGQVDRVCNAADTIGVK